LKKKKKSKGKKTDSLAVAAAAAEALPNEVEDIIKHNPALASEFQGLDANQISELVRKMKLGDILTGVVSLIRPSMGRDGG